jgi:hypothetical protein
MLLNVRYNENLKSLVTHCSNGNLEAFFKKYVRYSSSSLRIGSILNKLLVGVRMLCLKSPGQLVQMRMHAILWRIIGCAKDY